MYDLIVVGGGPVGSYLAKNFADKRHKVLLIERGTVGEPLKCSGHISKELFNFVPSKKEFIDNEIKGAIFHSGSKKYTINRKNTISYVIDRSRFDNFLFNEAKKSGVSVKKERVIDLEEERDKVVVVTNKAKYYSKIVAGCDGPLSTVRNSLKLPKPKKFMLGVFTKVNSADSRNIVDVYLDVSPDFFGWRIPRGKTIEYGLATCNKEEAMNYFRNFSKEVGFKINKVYSGVIPILPPKKITSKRCFLCGDAAAQVKPFTGGGIIYGFISASCATESIDPNNISSIEEYEKKWRKILIKEIWIGNIIRKIYCMPDYLRNPFLKLMEKLQEKVQMDKPSSIFR